MHLLLCLHFWPHPATVLGGSEVKCLTTPDERAELLFDLGVDVVITQTFDRSVANTSARDFAERLKQHLGLKQMFMGYDFALGKGREGNAATADRDRPAVGLQRGGHPGSER